MKGTKILARMLALFLAVSVTACGRLETQEQDTPSETTAQETESIETADTAANLSGRVTAGTEEYRGFLMDNVLHSENDGDIHYHIYVPDSYDGSKPYALFVTLPGYEGLYFQGMGVNLESEECERCVSDALSVGYRLIDTASAYENEEGVGAAVKKSGIPREKLFITTKLWVQDAGYEGAKRAAEASMKRLGVDYLDLYLIHQPFGDYYGAWRAMEEMYQEGILRAIGVCNFDEARLVDLCANHEIHPAVNQVEIHPFYQQASAIQTMKRYKVQPEAWGPLSEGQRNIFRHRLLSKIAARYGKSTAQIILRWHIQRGVVVIPKSARKERMEENLNIWDFTLDNKDMDAIASLDIGHSEIINHYSACTAKALNAMRIHA